MLPAYMFGILGVLLMSMGAWLVITGRNFPGLLGRGFTDSDRIRMERAPVQYWRIGGLISLVTGFAGLLTAAVVLTYPAPSRIGIAVLAGVIAMTLLVLAPLTARFVLIGASYRLFRWDKP